MNPKVVHFYENTARYKLEVWSQWYSFLRPFARILIRSVSIRMNQLIIPLEPLETSHGMSSSLIRLENENGTESLTCWLRKSVKTNSVVYAGYYSACFMPAMDQDSIQVEVFSRQALGSGTSNPIPIWARLAFRSS